MAQILYSFEPSKKRRRKFFHPKTDFPDIRMSRGCQVRNYKRTSFNISSLDFDKHQVHQYRRPIDIRQRFGLQKGLTKKTLSKKYVKKRDVNKVTKTKILEHFRVRVQLGTTKGKRYKSRKMDRFFAGFFLMHFFGIVI